MNLDAVDLVDAIKGMANNFKFEDKNDLEIAAHLVTFGFQSWGQNKKKVWERFFKWLGMDGEVNVLIKETGLDKCFPLGKMEQEIQAVEKVIGRLRTNKKECL